MQNSMVILPFFCFQSEIPLLRKVGPNNQNFQFKLTNILYLETNWNMQSSMVVFTFSVLDWKHHFWEYLV